MTIPKIKIHNSSTGKEIEREMNAYELAERETNKLEIEIQKSEQAAKAEARSAAEAKLLELGLTTEDLKALLG
jgi:ribosomal protein L15